MSFCWDTKNRAERPASALVTTSITVTMARETAVRAGDMRIMESSTETMVMELLKNWGRDWEIICRMVSMSLV